MAGMPGRQESLPEFASSVDIPDSSEKNLYCGCTRTEAVIKTVSKNEKLQLVASLLLGQILSLLLCGTGVISQILETNHSITVPTSQSFLNYVFLGAVFGVPLAVRKDFMQVLKKNWWKYIILGLIDVEANYMIVRAYEFTNLTTIQLLDSFTIACVMVLSFFFLRVRYKLINLMGISLAVIGIMCLVLATVMGSQNSGGSNPLLGDLLCLGGAALYAVSNVAQEFLVKNHSIIEFLGLLGLSGSVFSGIQLIVLERASLARIQWSYEIGLLFFGFGVCLFLFYSLVPQVMKFSSAVVVNLSLLTADIYTFFFSIFFFHFMFSFFYLVAFFLIITGIFIYNIRLPRVAKPPPSKPTKKPLPASSGSTSNPEASSPKDIESSQATRKRMILRELLESSNFESSASGAKKRPPRKKRLSQRDSSTFSLTNTTGTTEGSPLAQSVPMQKIKDSSSSTMPRSSSYSYGSMPLSFSVSSSPSSAAPDPPQQPQRSARRSSRRSSSSKSNPVPVTVTPNSTK